MRRLFAAFAVLFFSGTSAAAFAPGDLEFTFLGIQDREPVFVQTGFNSQTGIVGVTLDKGYEVVLGTEFDLVARITNVSQNSIDIIQSNPVSDALPITADIVLIGIGTGQIPVGANFLGPVLVTFQTELENAIGNGVTLDPGEHLDFLWGRFDSSNVGLLGPINEAIWGVTQAHVSSVFFPNGQPTELLPGQPFYVTFTTSNVPEPAPFGILALGLIGLTAARKW